MANFLSEIQPVIFTLLLLFQTGCGPAVPPRSQTESGEPPSPASSVPAVGAEVEASNLFERTKSRALDGDAEAQYDLGFLYAKGEGVTKDHVESYKWVLLALAQSNMWSKEPVDRLEKIMTKDQMAEGRKLAREFKPRKAPQE